LDSGGGGVFFSNPPSKHQTKKGPTKTTKKPNPRGEKKETNVFGGFGWVCGAPLVGKKKKDS